MKVFDRRFLKYQLAAIKHNKYKNSILYPNIVVFFIGIYNRSVIPVLLICAGLIIGSIYFGYYRFNKETGATDQEFEKVLKKKYKEYENSLKRNDNPAIALQKIALAAELDYIIPDEGIEQVKKLSKKTPQLRKFATNILVCLYFLKYNDKAKVPKEYIDYMEKSVKEEKNVNYLSDSAKTYMIIGEYNKVINIADKMEDELDNIKKIRKPVYNAIYKTSIITAPFYKGESYKKLGNREKARDNFQKALEKCKSKTFKNVILEEIESV